MYKFPPNKNHFKMTALNECDSFAIHTYPLNPKQQNPHPQANTNHCMEGDLQRLNAV
jgi:hypothetical protein